MHLISDVLLSVARATVRSAADNARCAKDMLAEAVADRRELRPGATGPEALDEDMCFRLVASRAVGRLAYVARAGTPDIAPVNYVLSGRDVLVRSGPGPKLQAAERGDLVSFEVDDLDEQTHTGWSVVAAGRASVPSPSQVAVSPLPVPWAQGPRRHVITIKVERISGRRIGPGLDAHSGVTHLDAQSMRSSAPTESARIRP